MELSRFAGNGVASGRVGGVLLGVYVYASLHARMIFSPLSFLFIPVLCFVNS